MENKENVMENVKRVQEEIDEFVREDDEVSESVRVWESRMKLEEEEDERRQGGVRRFNPRRSK